MLIKYVPALCLAAHWSISHRFDAVTALISTHFAKRILEVLVLHDFSGSPTEEAPVSLVVGGFYAMVTWLFMRDGARTGAHAVAGGAVLGFVGMIGNLYHHVLLRRLRSNAVPGAAKQYHVPRGGLFEFVACPHYFFEIMTFVGAACMTQTVHTFLVVFWVACMLSGRSVATTQWYVKRFGAEYPSSRRHIIPLLF
jgi:hypothetical protein